MSPPSLPALSERSSGILLHPTSLPGPDGCGDLGPSAHRFARWLADAGQRLWQMLPVGPLGFGNSPYSALSAFAGNPLLVSLESLVEAGWLEAYEAPPLPADRVDYGASARHREAQLRKAHRRWLGLSAPAADRADFERFVEENAAWLEDWALYRAVKAREDGRPWVAWPSGIRDRQPEAMQRVAKGLADDISFARFEQWLFDRQWRALRRHCASLGVALIGDIPIFVAHDSADVWAHRSLFQLDESGWPTVVAGVPPDYFSSTGQRWGNPLYRWDAIREGDWWFWVDRVGQMLRRFDWLRLDHFIGFVRCWEIPADEPTAVGGAWRPSPGAALFQAIRHQLGLDSLPFIAEDLGAVSPEVIRLREELELPGTKILQFAFGDDPQAESFKPYNYPRLAAAYTGTHDNETVLGWLDDPGGPKSPRSPEQARHEREFALRFLGSDGSAANWDFIRALLASVANVTIFPLQDVLGLGPEGRMNRPGTTNGNWEWRFSWEALDEALAGRLHEWTGLYGRAPMSHEDRQ